MSKCPKCKNKVSAFDLTKINYGIETHCKNCDSELTLKKDIVYYIPNILILVVLMYVVFYVMPHNWILFGSLFITGILVQNLTIIVLPIKLKNDTIR